MDEANERERLRREETRQKLRAHVREAFGDNLPDSAKALMKSIAEEAKKPDINAGFDEDWMDEELKAHGLYTPELEIFREWLRLYAAESAQRTCDRIREAVETDELLSVIEDHEDAQSGSPDAE